MPPELWRILITSIFFDGFPTAPKQLKEQSK